MRRWKSFYVRRRCPGKSFLVRSLLARWMTLSWFQRYEWKANLSWFSKICNHFREMAAWSRNRWRWSRFFWKKDPLRSNFQENIPKGFTTSQNHVLCANFVKFGWPEMSKVVRCLPHKKNKISERSPALASARIAPKICQGLLQTIYSEFRKFHPNPLTSGGVIAETHHKVFPILGEASSPNSFAE